jgi:rhodanese-related sulfurtransferase
MALLRQALILGAVCLIGGAAMAAVHGLPTPPNVSAAEGGEGAACGVGEIEGAEEIRWITQAEARGLVGAEGVTFIDCRPLDLFVEGHVSGSLHVPAESGTVADELLATLRGAATIITYCDADTGCERSLRMASVLTAAGLPDVRVLEGGMPDWMRNGYPAESGTCTLCGDEDNHAVN